MNEAAARAKRLGGTVLMEPFDVLDVGRMAMVQDPTGAVLALWEPRRHAGAGVVGDAGSMCWNELATTDTARAGAFYGSLLGWSAESRPMGTFVYTTFTVGRRDPRRDDGHRPELGQGAAALAGVFRGARLRRQRRAVPVARRQPARPADRHPGVGRFAVLADPQGAVFAVITLAPRQ